MKKWLATIILRYIKKILIESSTINKILLNSYNRFKTPTGIKKKYMYITKTDTYCLNKRYKKSNNFLVRLKIIVPIQHIEAGKFLIK